MAETTKEITIKEILVEKINQMSEMADQLAIIIQGEKQIGGIIQQAMYKEMEAKHWLLEAVNLLMNIEVAEKTQKDEGKIETN